MSEISIEQLNHMIAKAKLNIDLAEAADRLQLNPDFQKVIGSGFLTEYALGMITAKAMHSNRGDLDQSYINSQLMGVGVLKEYLSDIRVGGHQAINDIESAEADKTHMLTDAKEI